MRFLSSLVVAVILAAGTASADPVIFAAKDGVTVHADYQGQGDRALIVLFHQAGSNLHEYDPIVQHLHELGFDTLAVSQRSGGARFGGVNDTADGAGSAPDYLDAYPDMEAALEFARGKSGRVVVWGSSYSSALVFKLASAHPKGVVGVLSFSPGEYFGAAFSVKMAAAKVAAPVYITSASDAGEIAAAKAIAAAVPGKATQFVPKRGAHGSSTLRDDENPKGAAENWAAVEAFLAPLR
jgi:pimeloyl-ACP methyl ester carboxylesterase